MQCWFPCLSSLFPSSISNLLFFFCSEYLFYSYLCALSLEISPSAMGFSIPLSLSELDAEQSRPWILFRQRNKRKACIFISQYFPRQCSYINKNTQKGYIAIIVGHLEASILLVALKNGSFSEKQFHTIWKDLFKFFLVQQSHFRSNPPKESKCQNIQSCLKQCTGKWGNRGCHKYPTWFSQNHGRSRI